MTDASVVGNAPVVVPLALTEAQKRRRRCPWWGKAAAGSWPARESWRRRLDCVSGFWGRDGARGIIFLHRGLLIFHLLLQGLHHGGERLDLLTQGFDIGGRGGSCARRRRFGCRLSAARRSVAIAQQASATKTNFLISSPDWIGLLRPT